MPKDAEQLIAENRNRIRGVDRRFIDVDSNQDRDLSFGTSEVEVGVSVEVYKRTTGTQIIAGHSDAAHGFGRGTFGHNKGEWSLVTDTEASVAFTKDGRKAVVEALLGNDGAITEGRAGVDSSDAVTSDADVGTEVARATAFSTKDDIRTVRAHTIFGAADTVGNPVEFGVFDASGRLLARVTISTPSIATDEEVKAEVILEFNGDGVGKSVITNDGEESIADSIVSPATTTGPEDFAFGTGTTDFSKSDSALSSEAFEKRADRQTDRDSITVKAHVFQIDTAATPSLTDPHSHDIGEVAVFDNDDNMIWATTVRVFTKDEDVAFNAEKTIRIK